MGGYAINVDKLVRTGRNEQEQQDSNVNESNTNTKPRARPVKIFFPDMDSKMRMLNALRLGVKNDRHGKFKRMHCQPD